MPAAVIVWLGIGVVAAVIEGLTTQLVGIWFAFGAVVAAVSVLLGASLYLQLILFALTPVLLLVGVRPYFKKRLSVQKQPTNADQLIGKVAMVTEPTDPTSGAARAVIEGLAWMARTQAGELLEAGERVTVLAIQGATLIVARQ